MALVQSSTVLAGVEAAADSSVNGIEGDKVQVVNMSLGGSGDPDDALSSAVDSAVELGVTFCIAAGNSGNFYTIGSPGTARRAITVGAVDSSDNLAYFSSKGPDGRICTIKPEVVAPGVDISLTYLDNTMETMSGTSMATPHVTGVCALLKSIHKDWSPATIKSVVMASAVDIGQEVMAQGAGRIDALGAAALTSHTYPADLSFGLDSSSLANWTVIDTMWVTNNDSVSQSFIMSFNDLTTGVSLQASPSDFSVASNDSQMVIVTLGVDNAVVPYPLEGSLAYGGIGELTGSKDTLRISWAFVKAARVYLAFDSPYPFFVIASNTLGLSEFDATWLDDYDAELTMPKGVYDLVTEYWGGMSDRIIVNEQIALDSTSHIMVSSSDAVDSVSLNGVDDNGQPLGANPSSMKFLTLGFPDSSAFVSFSFLGLPDSLLLSKFSNRFTLAAAEFANNGSNKAYCVEFDSLTGLQSSTSLSNLPSTFYSQNIDGNFPPDQGSYREMDCINTLIITDARYGVFGLGLFSQLDTNLNGNWSGKLYLTKDKSSRFSYSTGFAALDGPRGISSIEYPWFESSPAEVIDDSIGYTYLRNESQADLYLSPNSGRTSFSHVPLYPGILSVNNILGKSNLYDYADLYGPFDEEFPRSTENSRYTIYDDHNNVIASDSLIDFPYMGMNLAPGVYTYQQKTDDYYIRGVKGLATLTCGFDLRKTDPDSPDFTSLRLLNSKDIAVDSLTSGESGTLVFSAADLVPSLDQYGDLLESYSPIASDSTKLFYRIHDSTNWIALPTSVKFADPTIGIVYSVDVRLDVKLRLSGS